MKHRVGTLTLMIMLRFVCFGPSPIVPPIVPHVGWKTKAPYNDGGHPGKGLKDTLYSKSRVWGFRKGYGRSLKMPIDKRAETRTECAGVAYYVIRHDAWRGSLLQNHMVILDGWGFAENQWDHSHLFNTNPVRSFG